MLKRETSKADIAIIGIGSFGKNVLNHFLDEGMKVTIIDKDPDIIAQYSNLVGAAYVTDTTKSSNLEKIGIRNYEHVIVSIGQDINASILTSLVLLELGVENITVKASDDNHVKILDKIGITDIIFPDKEMGKRVAFRILYRSLREIVELNELQVMAQIIVSSEDVIGHDLASLDFTNNYGVIIAAIRRDDEVIIPSATDILEKNDIVIVIGENNNVERLTKDL